jgi:hypothetical protein
MIFQYSATAGSSAQVGSTGFLMYTGVLAPAAPGPAGPITAGIDDWALGKYICGFQPS